MSYSEEVEELFALINIEHQRLPASDWRYLKQHPIFPFAYQLCTEFFFSDTPMAHVREGTVRLPRDRFRALMVPALLTGVIMDLQELATLLRRVGAEEIFPNPKTGGQP